MTWLAIGLAALLFVLARAAQPFTLLVVLAWLCCPPDGRRGFFLRPAAALCALGLYPVTVFDIAAAALVLWAALH